MNTETLELRLPNGFVNVDRLSELKSLIEKYGDGYVYITKRQSLEIRDIALDDLPHVIERLDASGMSPIQTGQFSNVMGNPLASIDPDEVMDTLGRVRELSTYLSSQEHKRKWNFAIAGGLHNLYPNNDIILLPVKRKGRIGYSILLGGSLASDIVPLGLWIPVNDLHSLIGVILDVLNDKDENNINIRKLRWEIRWRFGLFSSLRRYRKSVPVTPPKFDFGFTLSSFKGYNEWGTYSYCGLNLVDNRFTPDLLDYVYALAHYGSSEIRLTGNQNFIIGPIPPHELDWFKEETAWYGLQHIWNK